QNAHISLTRTGMDPIVSNSDLTGKFKWEDISLYSDYSIRPELSTYYPNRLDIADIKKLQNYIMGTGDLINFEYMAADVNGDNKIRISDIDLLKIKILQPADERSLNWRFASETDTILNVNDLKTVSEVFDIMKYDGNIDFKAIYRGDINGANKTETESRSIVSLYTKKHDGNIEFYLSENMNVDGLQIELLIPGLDDKINIHSPYFEIPDQSVNIDKTNKSIRFITLRNFESSVDQPVFVINTGESGDDEVVLTNFSKILREGDQLSKLVIGYKNVEKNEFNISPNPGADIFSITGPSNHIEHVKDINGRSVPFTQNRGEFSIHAPSGIYFITLNHGGFLLTKKLIIY
ncbi:MAG: T9SS type A sorting domain-containing protein, partial [Saprospiraceae bacterium]